MLNNILKGLVNRTKNINVKILPSQGLFYKDDFNISITKADIDDIMDYEDNYINDNIGCIIIKLKKIVRKNCILSNGYLFDDIKSIDIIFLFMEIVKFTKGKAVSISWYNEELDIEDNIEFTSNYFNYFKIPPKIMECYDYDNKTFKIDGYMYSLPTIGVENSVTNYLIEKSKNTDYEKYNNYDYYFMFFLMDKNMLSFDEIDNLIEIFNFDISRTELEKVKNIIKIFEPMQKYELRSGDRIIEINSKIDLEFIWK